MKNLVIVMLNIFGILINVVITVDLKLGTVFRFTGLLLHALTQTKLSFLCTR